MTKHDELIRLLDLHGKLEAELKASSRAVWEALYTAEPALSCAILQLFPNTEMAAAWVCAPVRDLGKSPAREAAEGRTAEVMARVHATSHGYVG